MSETSRSQSDPAAERMLEHQLRESQERYRSLFDHHPDAIFAYDLDGRILSANRGCSELTGYTVEELLQRTWISLICPDAFDRTLAHVEKALQGEPQRFESAMVHRDGRRIELDSTAMPIWVGGEIVGLYGIARDITGQKRAEQQLKEKEQQYRSIFESTSDGVVIAEFNGHIVEANPAMCEMYGCKYGEFVGIEIPALLAPESREVLRQYVEGLRAGRGFRAGVIGVRKDGSRFHMEVHGSTVVFRGQPHVLAVAHDISERVKAYELLEQRVHERTQELSTLLDLSHSVSSALELRPLLGLIVDGMRHIADYDGASLLLREGDDLIFFDRQGPSFLEEVGQLRIPIRQLGQAWSIFQTGNSIIIDDVRSDDPMAAIWRAALGPLADTTFGYVHGWMGVPLMLKDQVLGLLTVASQQTNHYTQHHAILALAIGRQAAIAVENARLYEQARRWAAAEERARLARELHDSVTQALFSMTLHARTTWMYLERQGIDPASPLARNLQQLSDLTRGALAEMRALLFELRPGALREEGLVAALRKQSAALSMREELTIDVQAPAERLSLDEETEVHLYRLAQEALHNVAKHARARNVVVRIEQIADELIVEISDDGVGFDTAVERPGHMGLSTMADRALRLGGTIEINSRPGRGTTIRVIVPHARQTSSPLPHEVKTPV